MSRIVQLLVAILLCNVPEVGLARWDSMYSEATLSSSYARYSRTLSGLFYEDLVGRLNLKERQELGEVRLEMPLIGANRHPFDYYANAAQHRVYIPIFSVKFYDDFATAQAWLDRHGCSKEAAMDYAGFLRYGRPRLTATGRFPDPREALGIPSNAWQDQWVYKTSGNALKSTIYFLMAHEVGHVLYQHLPYEAVSAAQAQRQEIEADSFALNTMERIGVPPIALALFFSASSWFEPVRSDFSSTAAFRAYRKQIRTHPMTSERLDAIASRMEVGAARFVRLEPARDRAIQAVLGAARKIREISSILDDPKVREYQKVHGLNVSLKELSAACAR